MTLKEKIEMAACLDVDDDERVLTLTRREASAVSGVIIWAEEMLESINKADGETEGGNSIFAALEEETES